MNIYINFFKYFFKNLSFFFKWVHWVYLLYIYLISLIFYIAYYVWFIILSYIKINLHYKFQFDYLAFQM